VSAGRIVFFIAFVGSVLGSLHYYLWARLVREAHLGAPWGSVATSAIIALGVLLVAAIPLSFLLPRSASAPIVWVSYIWLGLVFFFVVLLAATDLARLVARLANVAMDNPPIDADRRLFLRRLIAAMVTVATIGLGATGLFEGLRRVRVKPIRVMLRRMRPTNAGYKIVQLSDVHVGPTIGRAFIEQIVAQTNALAPDLIVITGDLVDGTVTQLRDAVAPLAGLKARHGVFFVTGNHEYYSGVDEWLAHLPTLGIRVLRNERVVIGEGLDAFDLAGVDDWSARDHGHGHGADLERALAGRDRSRMLVLLAHQPKQIFEAAHATVDLQLSGHTHGGQMFPFGLLVKLQQPYVAGFHMHEGTALYVSCGTGYWGPPMRLGSPAEITQIELGMS
jgi:predicted MPP superfamily phosphohydrolase